MTAHQPLFPNPQTMPTYLVSICKEAVEDPSLARGDPLAVSSPLGSAGPPQAGVQIHIGGCRHAQVVGLHPTSGTQLVLMLHKALVHLPISWRDLRAVDVHILPACLSQDHIISEILDLQHVYHELQNLCTRLLVDVVAFCEYVVSTS